jgi:hypothetical protein
MNEPATSAKGEAMKKRVKKLHLAKETLRLLEDFDLDKAQGGTATVTVIGPCDSTEFVPHPDMCKA